MNILVNGQPVEWPTAFMTEAQVRLYTKTSPDHQLWQSDGSYSHQVHTIADLRFGHIFYTQEAEQ